MPAEADAPGASLAAAWDRYWGSHPELPSWHGATYQRRAKAAAGKTEPCELDEAFTASEPAPVAGGQVYMAADVSTPSGDDEKRRPKRRAQIELMFAAVARSVVVTAASFAVEPSQEGGADGGDDAAASASSSSVATFRCQMANSEDAMAVARQLEGFVSLGIDDGHAAVTPARLIVRGPGLARLLADGVTHAQLQNLFAVFGECQVALPAEVSVREFDELVVADATGDAADSPVVSVVYTSLLPGCAEADAHAALRTVQQHLAYDWGLIATYDAVAPLSTAVDAAWPAEGKRLRDDDEATAEVVGGDDEAAAAVAVEEAEALPRAPPVLRRAVRGAPVSS